VFHKKLHIFIVCQVTTIYYWTLPSDQNILHVT